MSTPTPDPAVEQAEMDVPAIIDFNSDPSHLTLAQGHAPVPELPGVEEIAPVDSEGGEAQEEALADDPWGDFTLPVSADPRTCWPSNSDGSRFRVTVTSLLHFLQEGVEHDGHGNVTAIKYWCLHRDGTLEITDVDLGAGKSDPWHWPLPLMAWPGAAWIEQWDGDFDRAIVEQLQPSIDNLPAYLASGKVLDEAEGLI